MLQVFLVISDVGGLKRQLNFISQMNPYVCCTASGGYVFCLAVLKPWAYAHSTTSKLEGMALGLDMSGCMYAHSH